MADTDYVDDFAFLENTPAQAESLLHSLEPTAEDFGLYVNANKTQFIYFKQKWVISTLTSKPLKLVDQLPYLGSNISSTESDVKISLAKTRIVIDRLSIIWKSMW